MNLPVTQNRLDRIAQRLFPVYGDLCNIRRIGLYERRTFEKKREREKKKGDVPCHQPRQRKAPIIESCVESSNRITRNEETESLAWSFFVDIVYYFFSMRERESKSVPPRFFRSALATSSDDDFSENEKRRKRNANKLSSRDKPRRDRPIKDGDDTSWRTTRYHDKKLALSESNY